VFVDAARKRVALLFSSFEAVVVGVDGQQNAKKRKRQK
jgi:hypothetical protein